jgi:hypothetical protein
VSRSRKPVSRSPQSSPALATAWYSKPKAIVLFVVGLIAGIAAFVSNLKTIGEFLGYGKPDKPTLSLIILEESPNVTVTLSDKRELHLVMLKLQLRKMSSLPLNNCNLEGWIENEFIEFDEERSTVRHNFSLPKGEVTLVLTEFIPQKFWGFGPLKGRIAVVCTGAATEAIAFKAQ